MIVGVVIIFSPIALAFLSTAPGANMWSEGDPNSGGAAIWLMFFTIPLGGIIGIIGFIMMIVGAAKGSKPATSAGDDKQV
jgi:TRAP-type C4-dicarboxylate transport system permease small subunit